MEKIILINIDFFIVLFLKTVPEATISLTIFDFSRGNFWVQKVAAEEKYPVLFDKNLQQTLKI